MKDPRYACERNDDELSACINRALDGLPRSMEWGHGAVAEKVCKFEYGIYRQCLAKGLVEPLGGSSYGRKRQ